ncbi:hypothetical protein GIY23_03065 [Allosaccharopolyspora coralli]|uniref:Right handed beta helix domain-containing protein n=1 Tax=Allosaccharopolyspora coralli TaxID=2665642 RepID=A0A5Q3Q2H0_9PSEU|nr:right-handed parallel beta-helix repeat-containing protein [Allosaccharopolyspora coralli]QGK68672.1 hypothetical protein GIY23_03065 [Allosaccharopolyspora coralli]
MRAWGGGFSAVAAVVVLTACTGGAELAPPPPAAVQAPSPLREADRRAAEPGPDQCTAWATTPDEATAALTTAEPGSTVCFGGAELAETDLTLQNSGTPQQPITLLGNTTVVQSVAVAADHVTVDGFTTRAGDGLVLEGDGLTARGNTVLDAADEGISCTRCTDSLLERNAVARAGGVGISIDGERIAVRNNEINTIVAREGGYADGIHFFGSDHVLSGNTVRDIKDDGYPRPPRTTCFWTDDRERPPTVDVEITNNRCVNVDHQCLAASAEDAGSLGAVGRSHTLRFHNNVCATAGSPAVLIRWFPHVEVTGNDFRASQSRLGISIRDESEDATVLDNRFGGDYPMFRLDETSSPGFTASGNLAR